VSAVLPPQATQHDVFMSIGLRLVDWILAGSNATVLTWGDKQTGKTHTMFGSTRDPGLVPRFAQGLFEEIQRMNNRTSLQVGVSFFNVVGEAKIDLLEHATRKLDLADSPSVAVIKASTQFHDLFQTARERSEEVRLSSDTLRHSFCRFVLYDTLGQWGGSVVFCDVAGVDLSDTAATARMSTQLLTERENVISLARLLKAASMSGIDGQTASSLANSSPLTQVIYPYINKNSRLFVVGAVSGEASDVAVSTKVLEQLVMCANILTHCQKVTAATWEQLCGVTSSQQSRHARRPPNAFDSSDIAMDSLRGGSQIRNESSSRLFAASESQGYRAQSSSNRADIWERPATGSLAALLSSTGDYSRQASHSRNRPGLSTIDELSSSSRLPGNRVASRFDDYITESNVQLDEFLRKTDHLISNATSSKVRSVRTESPPPAAKSSHVKTANAMPSRSDSGDSSSSSSQTATLQKLKEELAAEREAAKFWKQKVCNVLNMLCREQNGCRLEMLLV
jgi:hypothetical protein